MGDPLLGDSDQRVSNPQQLDGLSTKGRPNES